MSVTQVGQKTQTGRQEKTFHMAGLSYFQLCHAHPSTGLAPPRTEERISLERLSWRGELCQDKRVRLQNSLRVTFMGWKRNQVPLKCSVVPNPLSILTGRFSRNKNNHCSNGL